jgi:fructoselysine 6-kinase
MLKIAAMGDNVVDCYVAHGQMFPGGNCLNVSVHSRRCGAQSAYIGAIGRDRAGDVILAALQQEAVDVSHLRRLDGPTAYCVIRHQNGDRIFESFDLGVSMFTPTEADYAFLRGFSAVHVGQSSGLDPYITRIAEAAPLSYDFSIRRDRVHRDSIGPFCYLASVSGGGLMPVEVDEIKAELIEAGAQWVLVTRGQQGALLANATGQFTIAATPVQPVDTLGAGDSFIARVLYGLLANEQPDRLLCAAARMAAHTCLQFGAVGHGAPLAVRSLRSQDS